MFLRNISFHGSVDDFEEFVDVIMSRSGWWEEADGCLSHCIREVDFSSLSLQRTGMCASNYSSI